MEKEFEDEPEGASIWSAVMFVRKSCDNGAKELWEAVRPCIKCATAPSRNGFDRYNRPYFLSTAICLVDVI